MEAKGWILEVRGQTASKNSFLEIASQINSVCKIGVYSNHCTVEYESRFHRCSGGHFEVCWKATMDVGKFLEI